MIYAPQSVLDHVLAKHFKHREVARSQMAARSGIDNIPDSCTLEHARALAINVLEPVRTEFGRGFSPSSWYRSEDLERVVCKRGYAHWLLKYGYPDNAVRWQQYFRRKQHPTGCAADIEVPGVSNDYLYDWIKDNLEFDQLIREFPRQGDPMSGWVHVSFDTTGNRNYAFIMG